MSVLSGVARLQECQRLETILNLCTDLGHVEREPAAVSDLQKINKELEKLQVSDDESVFSDSPGSAAPESCFGIKSRDFNVADEHPVGQRQHGGYRETRPHSPAISLNSGVPSPSAKHRAKVSHPSKPKVADGLRHIPSSSEAAALLRWLILSN